MSHEELPAAVQQALAACKYDTERKDLIDTLLGKCCSTCGSMTCEGWCTYESGWGDDE